MATFKYQAQRADQTPVEGHIDADNLQSARHSLKVQGLLVSSIHEVEVAREKTVTPSTPTPVQPAAAAQLAMRRQITRILEIGKPLAPALLAYAQELRPGRRRLRVQRIASQLEHGRDSSHELEVDHIDEEWMLLLMAGASSGDPGQIASGLIGEFHQEGDLRGPFASALAYPLAMFGVSLAILLAITLWIIPTFQEMFADFGVTLPFPTVLVLAISQTIRDFWWAILIPGSLLAAFLFYNSRPRDWIVQRIPVFGTTLRLLDRARFTRYLAGLMEAEVPVADTLRISGQHTSQPGLRREANQLAVELDSGNTDFLDSPSCHGNLPCTVVHALKLQANPRAAALILRELSWMYQQQTRNRLAWISNLFEPVLIVFLGSAVGFYVIALFLPFVILIQNLT